MGQNDPIGHRRRGIVQIDWLVLSIFAVAVLLLVLNTVAWPDAERGGADRVGGLRVVGDSDVLVAFEDFTFDAEGWDPARTDAGIDGLGPVLGAFSSERLTRSYDLPAGTQVASVRLDLFLIGGMPPGADLRVFLNEAQALSFTWSEDEADPLAPQITSVEGLDVSVRSSVVMPRRSPLSLPGSVRCITSFNIEILVATPGERLDLRVEPRVAGAVAPPDWAMDNLSVVARGVGGARP